MVMGILNLTPDSFYPESRYNPDEAIEQVRRWEKLGCSLVDVGGESSRPGAEAISEEEEMRRVLPVVRAIRRISSIPLSVDTTKPNVMRACAQEGAEWLNDISALESPGMLDVAREFSLTVILMHKKGQPKTMQDQPEYRDVVTEVKDYLVERARIAEEAGIRHDKIWIDPGIGFGKKLEHNLALLRHLGEFTALGYPVVVGLSRKRWIADLWGDGDRLGGSLAGALFCMTQGVRMIRVHDVPETLQALRIWEALWTKS